MLHFNSQCNLNIFINSYSTPCILVIEGVTIYSGDVMQIERLIQITNILIDKKTVTAKELSQLFGVSTKTIYRDIDTLTLAGIPLLTTKGKNGGISILDNYKLNKSLLNNNEQENIIRGLEILKALNYTNVDDTLYKLKPLFNKSEYNLIDIEFSYWESEVEEENKFNVIKEGLFSDKSISFSYIDNYDNKTTREVYPLKLIFKNNAWYLSCFCLHRKDYRFFKVIRITNIKLLNEVFERSNFITPKIPNSIVWHGNKDRVILKFDSSCKIRVFDEFSKENIEINDKGEFIVNFTCNIDKSLYSYIISFGDRVSIIEPQSLKDKIKNYLKNILKNLE